MTYDAVTHDVVSTHGNGSKKKFRIFGGPMPDNGDTITLPADGQLIKARVIASSDKPEMELSVNAEAVELVE